jgi:hypothetical protein
MYYTQNKIFTLLKYDFYLQYFLSMTYTYWNKYTDTLHQYKQDMNM